MGKVSLVSTNKDTRQGAWEQACIGVKGSLAQTRRRRQIARTPGVMPHRRSLFKPTQAAEGFCDSGGKRLE